MSTAKTIIFVVLYYMVWFSCVGLAARGDDYIALLTSTVISLIQSTLVVQRKTCTNFCFYLLIITTVGYCTDSLLNTYHVLSFSNNLWGHYFAPPWILALWINFAVLCFGLRVFLFDYIRVLPVFGLLGFPLAYLAGMSFVHSATFVKPMSGPVIQGIIWSMLFPAMVKGCLHFRSQ